jgi:ParB/RepB/Spo0J family partition protein
MPDITKLDGVTRANAYKVPPEILQHAENSRRWDDNEVIDLALDIVERGQKVAVLVKWGEGDQLLVTDGRRRVAAIRYINENGLSMDGPLKVRCEFDTAAKEESFVTAVVTNLKRKGLSDIDLAHSITTLEKQGKTRKEISKLLEISEALISRTLKLITLPAAVQKDIHRGKIAASVGYEMAGDETATQEVAQEAAAGGKPTVEKIRKARREKAEKGEEAAGPKTRSRKVVYNLFVEWAGCTDGTLEDKIMKFASTMVKYMDGETGDRAVLNRLRDLIGE